MEARSDNSRFSVEALEKRSMMSTVAYGDFNKDGYVDMATVTSPTTITVSLNNGDFGYTVSAKLTAPKSLPITDVSVGDYNHDGKLDISAGGVADRFYTHTWLGKGNGTFGTRDTQRGSRVHDGW